MTKLVTGKAAETEAEKAAREEEEAAEKIREAAPRETCPFLGVQHILAGRETTRAEQMHGAPPVAPTLGAQFMPCLKAKCAFYDAEASTPCLVRGGLAAMMRVDAARRSGLAGVTVKP